MLDGYATTREIRRTEGAKHHTPVIAVTAHALVGERERALAAGMDDYVSKPIQSARLAEVLERWCPSDVPPRESEVPKSVCPTVRPPAMARAAPTASSLDCAVGRSRAVVDVFLRHVPDQMMDVGRAVADRDATALKEAAHKLKGGCLAVGVPTMARLCAALEPSPPDQDRLFADLQREFEDVRSLLELESSATDWSPARRPS